MARACTLCVVLAAAAAAAAAGSSQRARTRRNPIFGALPAAVVRGTGRRQLSAGRGSARATTAVPDERETVRTAIAAARPARHWAAARQQHTAAASRLAAPRHRRHTHASRFDSSPRGPSPPRPVRVNKGSAATDAPPPPPSYRIVCMYHASREESGRKKQQ